MPEIISNTSCLILLGKIKKLEILEKLYDSITVTGKVSEEYEEALPEFVKVKNPSQQTTVSAFEQFLDAGEASTLALALEFKDSIIVLDDLKARKVAKNLGCKYTGTLGVIVRASKMGIIKNPLLIIEELKENGFWIADEIVSRILDEAKK